MGCGGRHCRAQVTAVSTTQHSDTTAWRVSAAPHYGELLWKNLRCATIAARGCAGKIWTQAPFYRVVPLKPIISWEPAVHAGVMVRYHHSHGVWQAGKTAYLESAELR